MYDSANSDWISVVGDETGTYLGSEYTATEGIVAGELYQFRTRAMNRWGKGPFTAEPHTEILAATVPSKVAIPVTTIDPLTGGVMISWDEPNTNGAIILAYHIELLASDDSWQSDASCDGSLSSVVSSRECIIPMDTLTASFGYLFDELVYVRISASNQMGQGIWSASNSDGAKIRARPSKMSTVSSGDLSTSN
jgi:hypothetical protein